MPSMNIAIKKEAYDFLKELKGDDKSFSEVILSFKKQNNLDHLFGALKDQDWTKKEKNILSLREEFEKR